MYAATTSPDDMLAGAIFINGEKVADGYGGIYFVTMFNDVWASSNRTIANEIAKRIKVAESRIPSLSATSATSSNSNDPLKVR